MSEPNRLRNAGLRMALKMIPDDMIAAVPAKIAAYLNERLAKIELKNDEERAVIMLSDFGENEMLVNTVTVNADGIIERVVEHTELTTLMNMLIKQTKEAL